MQNERVDRIMTTSPATVAPGDSLAHARQLLTARGIHHVPVVDDGKLVGILSETDFLKLHLLRSNEPPAGSATVASLMQANPAVLPSNANLRDAAERFLDGGFHSLPVVDGDALVGILTTTDLIQSLLRHIPRGDGSIRQNSDSPTDGDSNTEKLKAVCLAAEHYIRSGHAEHEHSILLKRLDELRNTRTQIL